MLFLDFIKWWYGPGWALRLKMLSKHLNNFWQYFSVATLLKTLFSPWRQNINSSQSDRTLGERFNALLDNLVSRMVGFTVRLFVLVIAVIGMIVVLILNITYIITWPIIPLSPAIIISIGAIS